MFLVININEVVNSSLIAVKHKLSLRVVLEINFIALLQSLTEALHEGHVLAV